MPSSDLFRGGSFVKFLQFQAARFLVLLALDAAQVSGMDPGSQIAPAVTAGVIWPRSCVPATIFQPMSESGEGLQGRHRHYSSRGCLGHG